MYVMLIHRVWSEGHTPAAICTVALDTDTSTVLQDNISEVFRRTSMISLTTIGVGISLHVTSDKLCLDLDNEKSPLARVPKNMVYAFRRTEEGWTESWRNEEGELVSERNDDPRNLKHLPKDHS